MSNEPKTPNPTLMERYANSVDEVSRLKTEAQKLGVSVELEAEEKNSPLVYRYATAVKNRDLLTGAIALKKPKVPTPSTPPAVATVAVKPAGPMTYEQAQAEYRKITDPQAQKDFREKHAVELGLKRRYA